jgi:hypothetical protein
LAAARGYELVGEYTDTISGTKSKRPGLDKLMADASRGRFDIVMAWSFDRMARSVRHLLEVLDELGRLDIAYVNIVRLIRGRKLERVSNAQRVGSIATDCHRFHKSSLRRLGQPSRKHRYEFTAWKSHARNCRGHQ